MFDNVKSVGELAVSHGRAGFERVFEEQKQMFDPINSVGFAFEFDPALAGGCFYSQLMIEGLQIARIIVKELLRQAGVFKVQSLSGHG